MLDEDLFHVWSREFGKAAWSRTEAEAREAHRTIWKNLKFGGGFYAYTLEALAMEAEKYSPAKPDA